MKVLGLTGSIAMGKSHAAAIFRSLQQPVFDSDLQVALIYRYDRDIVSKILNRFPSAALSAFAIDRRKLAQLVFQDQTSRRDLEAILHPPVFEAQRRFLQQVSRAGNDLAVLDIPLLFEGIAERRLDATLVVGAGETIQKQRVLRRSSMDQSKFALISKIQMSAHEKRKRADFFVPSGSDRGQMVGRLVSVLEKMKHRSARAWPAAWHSQH